MIFVYGILLLEIFLGLKMGQEMCCAADEAKEFAVKGKPKIGFKDVPGGEKKYIEAKRPEVTNPYV